MIDGILNQSQDPQEQNSDLGMSNGSTNMPTLLPAYSVSCCSPSWLEHAEFVDEPCIHGCMQVCLTRKVFVNVVEMLET